MSDKPARLPKAEVEAIRARHEQDNEWQTWGRVGHAKAHKDRAALLADRDALVVRLDHRGWIMRDMAKTIDKQQTEIERLRETVADMDREAMTIGAMIADTKYGDKLKAADQEVERLREEVQTVRGYWATSQHLNDAKDERIRQLECKLAQLGAVRGLPKILKLCAEALEIASDWNVEDVQIFPPKTWRLPAHNEDAAEGWCSTFALAERAKKVADELEAALTGAREGE